MWREEQKAQISVAGSTAITQEVRDGNFKEVRCLSGVGVQERQRCWRELYTERSNREIAVAGTGLPEKTQYYV